MPKLDLEKYRLKVVHSVKKSYKNISFEYSCQILLCIIYELWIFAPKYEKLILAKMIKSSENLIHILILFNLTIFYVQDKNDQNYEIQKLRIALFCKMRLLWKFSNNKSSSFTVLQSWFIEHWNDGE